MSQALVSMVRHMDLRKGSGFRPLCCLWKAQVAIVALGCSRNYAICLSSPSARLLKQTACFSEMLLQAACSDSASNESSHRLIAKEPQEKRLAQLCL